MVGLLASVWRARCCARSDDAVLDLIQHVHQLGLARLQLLQLLLVLPGLEHDLLLHGLLALLRSSLLGCKLGLCLLCLAQLVGPRRALRLQALELQPELGERLALLALGPELLDLGLALGLVKLPAQLGDLLLQLCLSSSPRLTFPSQGLRILGPGSAEASQLATLHLGLGLEPLQLALHCGELLPLLLALLPEAPALIVEVGPLALQLLLPVLQHLRALLGRGEAHAEV
mmetsp:Transcript_91728/g.243731  ORF Transcript_91728/g.243731 Transcript_91728/m.243731 type:complete len:230 (+) Transcript_91728:146-835(+)